jgi:hypothetical protein
MSAKISPPINEGDRIVVIYTSDDGIPYGTRGIVTRTFKSPWGNQYDVKWDNGSSLFLLDEDKWMSEEDFDNRKNRKITENIDELINFSNVIKYFKMGKIKRYLDLLQKTSVTNMFGASPYLYIGEDILRKEHYNEDSEEFEELCDMADEVKSIMIQGAMKILEKENKEINVETVGRKIKLWAPKVLNFWMTHY